MFLRVFENQETINTLKGTNEELKYECFIFLAI